jgi:hypothetical protein
VAEVEDTMREAITIRYQFLEANSVPERELLGFVRAVTELLGAEQTRGIDRHLARRVGVNGGDA